MPTISLTSITQRFCNTQIRNSQKKGKTMKRLVTSLLTLAVLGFTTSVYANGWVTVPSANIRGVGAETLVLNGTGLRPTSLILNVAIRALPGGNISSLAACSASSRIYVLQTEPIFTRALVLMNSAIVMRGRLDTWVQCRAPVAGGPVIPVAISVDMLL